MKNKKMFIVYNIVLTSLIIFTGVVLYKNQVLSKENNSLKLEAFDKDIKLADTSTRLSKSQNEMNAYKMLYDTQEGSIKEYKALYKKTQSDLDTLKSQIYLSKEKEKKVSRGDYIYKDLSQFEIMTTNEMNAWIAERAPKGSPFIGKGDIFLKAASIKKIDPKLIVALSATECDWGRSSLARNKGNYFSITAYNDNPYTSAKSFDGDLENNILDGVEWIKQNFYDQGKTSLYKMQFSGHNQAYSQNDDGSANPEWMKVICNIVYK